MSRYLLCIFSLMFAGCAGLNEKSSPPDFILLKKNHLTKINNIQVEMSYAEVTAIMGSSVKVGYKQSEYEPNAFEPVTLNQPFRAEILSVEGKDYEVLYYFTEIHRADGIIVDDELTPLIFQNQKLIGKGWDFLFKLRNI